jgi:hypothetical protein
MLKNKKLTVYSYPEHYVIDGPEGHMSAFLNELLEMNYDLDTLPVGVYELTARFKKLKLYTKLTRIDEI